MESLFVLLLVAVCHGLVIDVPKTPQLNLKAPELKKMISKDDPNNTTSHEIIHWTEVKSADANDPVIGYKKINISVIPDGVPKEIVTAANETSAIFRDVHVDVPYQISVLAFTARGEGPLSAPVRITLHNPKEVKTLNDLVDKLII